MANAVECRSVSIEINRRAILSDLNLEVPQGGKHALLGGNGSGKTALLNAICGLLPLAGGQIWINGERADVLAIRDRALRCHVSRSFQSPQLVDSLSVGENIALARASTVSVMGSCLFGRVSLADQVISLQSCAEELGISPGIWSKKVGELSYGWRRIADLTRALLAAARLYLLDEPFANLHSEIRQRVCEFIDRRIVSQGATVLVVSHEPDLVSSWTDSAFEIGRPSRIEAS